MNGPQPPTTYPAGSFDVIYAISIFTHLTVAAQQAWLDEFWRLLAPGGCLIFSACGERFRSRLTRAEAKRFDAGEAIVRFEQNEGSNLCGAFHSRDYVEGSMLGGRFNVTAFRPGSIDLLAQDLYLV